MVKENGLYRDQRILKAMKKSLSTIQLICVSHNIPASFRTNLIPTALISMTLDN